MVLVASLKNLMWKLIWILCVLLKIIFNFSNSFYSNCLHFLIIVLKIFNGSRKSKNTLVLSEFKEKIQSVFIILGMNVSLRFYN